VQNQYNLVQRENDALVDSLARQNIACVPFFPLGGLLSSRATGDAQYRQNLPAALRVSS
jgi:pyridoxine 4-dehydrogenase